MKVLQQQGVDAEAVRNATPLPPRVDEVPALVPFNGPSRKILELTFREALRLGHNYIGTEHILLAMLEVENDDGPLRRLGLDKSQAEGDVAAMLQSLTSGDDASA